MTNFLGKLTCSTLLLIGLSAQASFIKTDVNHIGDSLGILHESTGLEWLNLTQTSGMSMNGVASLLDTDLYGWRVPTNDEVTTMATDVWGFTPNGNLTWGRPGRNEEYFNGAKKFKNLFSNGHTLRAWHVGAYTDEDGIGRIFGSHFNKTNVDLNSGTFGLNRTEILKRDSARSAMHEVRGVFLVSDGGTTLSSLANPELNINNINAPINSAVVTIPEPAPALLLGIGLLSVGLRSRKLI